MKCYIYYLLFTMILYALSGQLATLGSEYKEGFFFAETITVLSTTIIGVLYCYDGNKSNDGKDFIKRFISISWVVTVRMTTILLVLILISIFIVPDAIMENPYVDILLLIVLSTIYFWLINRNIKYISSKTESSS